MHSLTVTVLSLVLPVRLCVILHDKSFFFILLCTVCSKVAAFPQKQNTQKMKNSSSRSSTDLPTHTHSSPSYEVFLLFVRSLVAVLLVGVLSRSQLPRRPVVALVVAEIPVKQEAQSSYRQQDENNNHWKSEAEYHLKKIKIKKDAALRDILNEEDEQLPAMTAESGPVGGVVAAAVVTTAGKSK